ncbi:uncharacterized protein LOC131940988 isoform X1 [Physella acuta]|nr:uncharacterized protein LOC131940988 isoform X1 [Physella acuta]XP_059155929.1 uncharacterized protein LOC131940988 isoform X1 [Physella acuta]XP_059155939.1 uncharacterized protein LOC131940988 isoform X1 [Physella acuta]
MSSGRSLKFVLVGDSSVGKTSISSQFNHGYFSNTYAATYGGHFFAKHLPDLKVTVQLWDTGGEERYRAMLPLYTRDAMCAILVYDVSDRRTFASVVDFWTDYVESNTLSYTVKVLVGNKIDKTKEVDEKVARDHARDHGMLFYETSAKQNQNIDTLFHEAAKEVVLKIPDEQVKKDGVRLEKLGRKKKKWRC